jgi:hypothetical protein
LDDCENRRGDAAGAALGCTIDSIDTIASINKMKRE